jgi:opacity protein-like surface antigen
MQHSVVTALVMAMAVPAFAVHASAFNHLDLFYMDSGLRLDDNPRRDGDGLGLRGTGMISPTTFVHGEYQRPEYALPGGGELRLDQVRAGLGGIAPMSPQLSAYFKGEYIRWRSREDTGPFSQRGTEDGFGVHAGLHLHANPRFGLYGGLGYVDVDQSGLEINAGAVFNLTEHLGAFADYRRTDLDRGDNARRFDDWRLGLRFRF